MSHLQQPDFVYPIVDCRPEKESSLVVAVGRISASVSELMERILFLLSNEHFIASSAMLYFRPL